MKKKLICITVSLMAAGAIADVAETFTVADQSPWNGTGDSATWVGDLALLQTVSGELRPISPAAGVQKTVMTDIGTLDVGPKTWSATNLDNEPLSGTEMVSIVLWSSTTDTATIESGIGFSGMRIALSSEGFGGNEGIYLQETSGTGWNTLANNAVFDGIRANYTIEAQLVGSVMTFGYYQGSNPWRQTVVHDFGSAPTIEAYTGLTLDQGDGSSNAARVTSFSVTSIPEPATLGLFAAFGGAGLFIRRRIMK